MCCSAGRSKLAGTHLSRYTRAGVACKRRRFAFRAGDTSILMRVTVLEARDICSPTHGCLARAIVCAGGMSVVDLAVLEKDALSGHRGTGSPGYVFDAIFCAS